MFSIIRVPTCFSKQTTEVNLSSEDMKNIKAKDPFLYYSIPGVRAARMKLKDVNDPEMNAKRKLPTTTKVTRRSRVSFECHTSVFLDDILKDLEGEHANNGYPLYDNETDIDVLFALLAAASDELQEARK